MLVGIPPFYHQNQNFMFQLIKEGEVRFPTQLPIDENVQDLIKKVFYSQIFNYIQILIPFSFFIYLL